MMFVSKRSWSAAMPLFRASQANHQMYKFSQFAFATQKDTFSEFEELPEIDTKDQSSDFATERLTRQGLKADNIQQLVAFYVKEKTSLSTQQQALLLNQVVKLHKESMQDQHQNRDKIQLAEDLFKQITTQLIEKLGDLNDQTTFQLLKVMGFSTHIKNVQLTQTQLSIIEDKVMKRFSDYMNMDLSLIIVSLLKQNYMPNKIIEELNQMVKFAIFNLDQCQRLLDALFQQDFRKNPEIYKKLFDQVKLSSVSADDKASARTFVLLNNYLQMDLFNDTPKQVQIHTQHFIDKFVSIMQERHLRDVDYNSVFRANTYLSQIKERLDKQGLKINTKQFSELSCSLIDSKINTMSPKNILKSFDLFQDEFFRQTLMETTMEAFKENRIRMNMFNFKQACSFIRLVSEYCPKDLYVFHNYMDQAVHEWFFSPKDLEKNFGDFVDLILLFSEQGFISQESYGQCYFHWLLTMKKQIIDAPQNPTDPKHIRVIDNDDLIKSLWILATTDKKSEICPIFPALLERLYKYKSNEKFTEKELIQLYQIHLHTLQLVEQDVLPKEFKKVIPKKAIDRARIALNNWDKQLYRDEQIDIAQYLLKLRVSMRENEQIGPYKVDIYIPSSNTAILLQGKKNSTWNGNKWQGLYAQKKSQLQLHDQSLRIHVINADKWQQTSEDDRFAQIYDLIPSRQNQGSIGNDDEEIDETNVHPSFF